MADETRVSRPVIKHGFKYWCVIEAREVRSTRMSIFGEANVAADNTIDFLRGLEKSLWEEYGVYVAILNHEVQYLGIRTVMEYVDAEEEEVVL